MQIIILLSLIVWSLINPTQNLTLLIGKEKVFSTDIGPGNRLIDDFCCKYFNREFDKNGELSSDGNFKTKLVDRWLRYKIFKRKFIKRISFAKNRIQVGTISC